MKQLLLTTLLSALTATAALADIRPLEDAHEVSSERIRLPGSEAGSLILRECPRCEPVTLRVNARSAYQSGNRTLGLTEFKARFAARQRGGEFVLTVFHDPETKFVTRVVMD